MQAVQVIPYPRFVKPKKGVCPPRAKTERILKEEMQEAYLLEIGPASIVMTGGRSGLRYAETTLRQLKRQYGPSIPCMRIEDKPSSAYRGFMLDVSRHFMPVGHIKQLLDAAALFKLNRFHWHLTDDQGWRIEIKSWPRLTATGAFRGRSAFGACDADKNNNGYYTQAEIREIVRYAAKRGIETIPEIEIPGHASAMLAAYPWLGCELPDRDSAAICKSSGVFDRLLCAGKEESLAFIKDVLMEVASLFPSRYIHIGGDEALKLRWRRCPYCQRRMKELGIGSEDALQRWLVLEMGAFLEGMGKQTIVWNDALEGGDLPPYFIVQFWRGNKALACRHAEAGGRIIDSDTAYSYLDYPDCRIDSWRILSASPAEYADNSGFMGAEFPLWTEFVPDFETACRRLFPRLAAGAERAWDGDGKRRQTFGRRWAACLPFLTEMGIQTADTTGVWRLDTAARTEDRKHFEAARTHPDFVQAVRIRKQLSGRDRMERLMQSIGMPCEIWPALADVRYQNPCREELQAMKLAFPGICVLASQIDKAAEARDEGAWKKYPEEVFLSTLSAFTRQLIARRQAEGRWAYKSDSWMGQRIRARIFRLGSLEFELKKDAVALHAGETELTDQTLKSSMLAWREFTEAFLPERLHQKILAESPELQTALQCLMTEAGLPDLLVF